jgi:predicted MFS family arabinose efflux permease
MVAVVQLAITLGAAGGGLLFDAFGPGATFFSAALILLASALLGHAGSRTTSRSPAADL